VLEGRCLGRDGSLVDVIDFATRERERLVLKHTASQAGEHVYLGSDLSPNAWTDRIAAAVADGRWIVQERVLTAPQYMAMWHRGRPEHSVSSVDVVLGPILTGNGVTGIYARAAPYGTGVITGKSPSHMELTAIAASLRSRHAASPSNSFDLSVRTSH
jgi:hypothetical protein